MSDCLFKRIFSAIFLLVLLFGVVAYLPIHYIQYFIALILLVVCGEWLILCKSPVYVTIVCLALLFFGYIFLYKFWLHWLFMVNSLLALLFLYGFGSSLVNKNSLLFFILEVFMFVMILLSFGQSLYALWHLDIRLLFMVMSLVWAADSAAYFIGSKFGSIKCFGKINKNKTLEGVAGAVVCATLLSFLYSICFEEIYILHGFYAVIVGCLVGVTCMLGDLLESTIKRIHDAKDSGKWIPGHGGLLDRLDGMMLSLPCFWGLFVFIT